MTTPNVSRPVFTGSTGNSYSSTTTQVTDSQIRYVDDKLEYLEFDDFPLQKTIGYGKPIAVRKVEWADDRRNPSADQLAEALDDSETDVDVDNGARFQQYQVIKVDDEVMLVTGISSNTLTVTRAWGASVGAAHDDNSAVRIIGVAMPENIDTPPAPMSTGGFYYNFFQIFDSGILVSNRANANGEQNYLIRRKEYNKRVEQKFIEKAEQLEYTLFHGLKQDAATTLPSTMGGFPEFITEHTTDLNDAALRKTDLMEIWQEVFGDVGKANMANTVICGAFMKEVLASYYAAARQLTGSDRQATEVIDRINTDFGPMSFLMHWHCPVDEMYGINTKNLSLHPFGDYGRWHEKRLPEAGPYMKGRITGDYTLIAKGDRAHWKITDIGTTRALYDLND